MKVTAINGSPNKNGNTAIILGAMSDILKAHGIETEIVQVGSLNIHGCIACGKCRISDAHTCVIEGDIVNETSLKMRASDGLILAAPTYYGGIPGTMKCFLDRVFFSSSSYFKYKAATAVASVRRAGGTDVAHQLMNFLNLSETVTPPSQYWTVVYGRTPGEVLQDGEGMQTVTKNARALAWLLRIIDASRGKIPLPDEEPRIMTNFVR
ncbi:MAG: flavodoxin family protein [Synergistaceae bacterium]|jgi:multimeric flavodoxin WrbA|nr:flavodoxin family protein [Synergistaceae bacterium]